MSSIDKDKLLYNLIQLRSKYLLMDINEAIKELKKNIDGLQTNLTTNKSKLCKLCIEINKYYKPEDTKNIKELIKHNDKIEDKPQKYENEQLNEVLKHYPKPIIPNDNQDEIKQNLTDIRDNIIELNKNLTHKEDINLNDEVKENTVSMDLNFTDTKTN